MAQFPGYRTGGVVQPHLFEFTVGEIIDDVFSFRDRGPPYIMCISSFFGRSRGWQQVPKFWFQMILMGFVQT